jgi:glycosyltransferase involved in cell wall biosynthesis
MHILLIHQAFVAINEPGGTRHHELARYLSKRGHHVTIIASPISYLTGTSSKQPSQDYPFTTSDHISIIRTYTYPALHRSFIHRILSFLSFMVSSFIAGLQVKDVDLVWGTSPPIFQGMTAWVLSRLKNVPFLFEVRDLWPAFAVQIGVLQQPLLIRLSEWLEHFLYTHADRLVVNSPGFVSHVKARGADKVALIPNGTDPSMFDPQNNGSQFRISHGLEGKFLVLYAGAHGVSNDLEIVLKAAQQIADNPNINIVFVGDGKDKPALMGKAVEMGLINVHFLPPVPKAEMGTALAAADACVAILKPIPLYSTVFPNKVFDYMAAGRPVILAIDGVIREVVEKAGAGIFVSPGDPEALANTIKSLANNPKLCTELGQNGRNYVEMNYDRAKLADQLASILEQLVCS